MKIGFSVVATNKYLDLGINCLKAIKQYVKIKDATVIPFLFTNHHPRNVNLPFDYNHINIQHLPWPMLTLLRYQNFIHFQDEFKDCDYIYYIDADLRIVDTIGEEILGDFVVTRHPGFVNCISANQFTYERNPNSKCGISYNQGIDYYIGSFNGGAKDKFLSASLVMRDWLNEDLKNNYIPIYHDESALNKYCLLNPPSKILPPNYCSPENWPHIPAIFGPPKILALDKNHNEIRKEV